MTRTVNAIPRGMGILLIWQYDIHGLCLPACNTDQIVGISRDTSPQFVRRTNMASPTTFFLTGCASGIGRHLTGELARRGQCIFATDANWQGLETAAREDTWQRERVFRKRLDVRNQEEWQTVFSDAAAAMGHVDVCMNIAGIMRCAWVHEASHDELHEQVDGNVKGVMFGTQAAARHMAERRSGHIVNIASIAGLAPIPGLAVYCGTKYAVRGYSLSAACELRKYNVAVTTVCPDAVDTPLLHFAPDNDAADIVFSASRMLNVDEISALILNRVLTKRPLIAAMPWRRILLARLAELFPSLAIRLSGSMAAKGRRRRGRAY